MIKKITGIATILVLILGIAIGIAKASPKVAELKQQGKNQLASKQAKDVGHSLYQKDVNLLSVAEKTNNKDVSAKGDKEFSKPETLLDVHDQDVVLDKVDSDLVPLDHEKLSLAKDWNKDLLADV